MKCKRCDGRGKNCWVFISTVTGAFYSHARFIFAERCPFCHGSGKS